MKLYIMRHGEAENQAISDEKRELTEYGKTEVLDVAELIQEIKFDLVIVSTFIRAKQTADLIVNCINYSGNITTSELFCPESNPKQAHDYIDALLMTEGQHQNILIVSHMPLVSFLMAELTFDGQMPIFQTAAVASIDYQPERMKGEFVEMLCPFHVCDS